MKLTNTFTKIGMVVASVATFYMGAMEAAQAIGIATKYHDVEFLKGDISFADEVVDFKSNVEYGIFNKAPYEKFNDPTTALGAANSIWGNQDISKRDDVSLGNGGELILKFTDNALIGSNDDKADLWVFEAGGLKEGINVFISKDGNEWFDVGNNGKKQATGVDIDAYFDDYGFTSADRFSYVKLVDDGTNTYNQGWSGADIDAVGAISTVAVPEPTSILGLLVIGMVGGSSVLKRKLQKNTMS